MGMKEIKLINGGLAQIDDHRYDDIKDDEWYCAITSNNTYAFRVKDRLSMHQILFGSAGDGLEWDHIDNNGLNNQENNIRRATRSQNNANSRKRNSPHGTSSKFKGVYWDGWSSKWRAQIVVDKKKINLGRFSDPTDAARAYDEAATLYFGEFAKTNKELRLL